MSKKNSNRKEEEGVTKDELSEIFKGHTYSDLKEAAKILKKKKIRYIIFFAKEDITNDEFEKGCKEK